MKNIFLQKNKVKNKRGIAILYAVIVAILMVAIGATITSIALRQTILSSTGRESQYAFYAANTGIECARYWDFNSPEASENKKVFPVENHTDETLIETPINGNNVECAGGNIITGDGFESDFADDGWDDTQPNIRTFRLELEPEDEGPKYCVEVTVQKIVLSEPDKNVGTLITSRGYNTCDDIDKPRAVERGMEMYYEY